MSELLLDSLEIKGYRCFEHLNIEKLGRVNLIVGKNNVGKTALLEALWIWAERFNQEKIIKILDYLLEKRKEKENKKEIDREFKQMLGNNGYGETYRHLFFKRPRQDRSRLFISSIKRQKTPQDKLLRNIRKDIEIEYNSITNLLSFEVKNESKKLNLLFIESGGISNSLMTQIWDDIILENKDDNVMVALNAISDEIIDLNFINYPRNSNSRIPVVKVHNLTERIPLSSFGEGMNRLLGLSLSLLNSKNGILLIDEIESGLHYSVLPDVWKLIFKTAKDLNVQVFATTHSKDCIEAFAKAAYDSPEEGMLIRLERHGEKIVAKTIEEEMLVDAVNYEVEVR